MANRDYSIGAPDGSTLTINGPEDATPAQLRAAAEAAYKVVKQGVGTDKPLSDSVMPKGMMATLGGALGKGVGDVALGAQRLVGRGLQGVGASTAGDWLVSDADAGKAKLAAELKPYRDQNPMTAGFGDIAGNIIATLPVGGALGKLAGYAGASAPVVNALSSAGFTTGAKAAPGVGNMLSNLALRSATGGVVGGASTLLADPEHAGLGAAVGALAPPAIGILGRAGAGVGRTFAASAEPFYDAGKNAIIGRALRTAAGDQADTVATQLAAAGTPFVGPSQGVQRTVMGEIVPGSVPDVAQASGNAGVAALQRSAVATQPHMTTAMSERASAQNAARVNALTDMAGAGGEREFTAANREATAGLMYGNANRAGLNVDMSFPEVAANVANFAQRMPADVIAQAKKIAKIDGMTMSDNTSLQGLHYMKLALDDLIGAADRAGNGTLKRAYTGLKNDLVVGINNMSPDYAAASKTFASMSRPINQMDTAQAIIDKSVSKLNGNLQPNAYANSLTDKTAASATGFGKATLENTMEPKQLNLLQSILEDVQRSNAAQNTGRGPGSDTVQKLAYSNILERAGLPTMLTDFKPAQAVGNVMLRGADAIYGRANRELGQRLAEVMLDPAQAAMAMTAAKKTGDNKILALLASYQNQAGQIAVRSAPLIAAGR